MIIKLDTSFGFVSPRRPLTPENELRNKVRVILRPFLGENFFQPICKTAKTHRTHQRRES